MHLSPSHAPEPLVEPVSEEAVIPALVQSGGYPAEFVEANRSADERGAREEGPTAGDV
jgi:hypothetical protein